MTIDDAREIIEQLKRENAALQAAIQSRNEQVDTLAGEVGSKQREIERLQERLQLLLQRLYGRRSEKLDPDQLLLFLEQGAAPTEAIPPHATEAPDDEETPPSRGKRRRERRAVKLKDLPRQRIEHDVALELRVCGDCGNEKHKIGEEVSEEIDYVPASVIVNEHVRPKYACRDCGDGVVIADLPPRLIEGGLPGPGLVAQIVTAKYSDHLPLHRQEAIFRRAGLELSRQTMCDWIRVASELLLPIVQAMRRQLLRRPVVLSDDTSVRVQTNAASKGCHKAFLWVWLSPEEDLVVYDFHLTRGQSVVEEFLENFEGEVLLVDGYAGYNPCKERGVKRAGCLAHARRYVKDAMASHPREASELLALIQMLYLTERRAKELGLDEDARLRLRQEESRPILDELRQAVERMKPEVLPKSAFGEALEYLTNQWEHLVLFAEDGRIPIDNNASERAMRPVAVGRKNWLFAGSAQGGRRAAILYSLIETCKRMDIDPFAYLRDVLARVTTHPARRVDELTPAAWKSAREPVAAATLPTSD